MSVETGVNRDQIVTEIGRSAHGNLMEYEPIIGAACRLDPEFVARLIAWDYTHGQIKDSKIGLPVITLKSEDFPESLLENSVAHLALAAPRELLRALRFSIEAGTVAHRQRRLEKTIRRYLRAKQLNPGQWSRLAVRHRRALKSLYSLTHCSMPEWASVALYGQTGQAKRGNAAPRPYPSDSIFADIAQLSRMDPAAAAGVITKWHLSPLIVSGAMAGAKAKQDDTAVMQATMEQMSDTELVTRAKSLERRGVAKNAATKEAFRSKVARATKSGKATLKTSVAADEVDDESMKTMLRELQERQIQAQKDAGRGMEGNWAVIVDKSQSQEHAIKLAAPIAAAITKFVTGRVWLVFADQDAFGWDVTGLSLEDLKLKTQHVIASNPTSYGVGLAYLASKGVKFDGICLIGDGGENFPPKFADAYKQQKLTAPVYFFKTYVPPQHALHPMGNPGLFGMSMKMGGLSFTEFDFTHGKVDYYSIPNIVQTMKTDRFRLVDQIMACPLLALDQVLPRAVVTA